MNSNTKIALGVLAGAAAGVAAGYIFRDEIETCLDVIQDVVDYVTDDIESPYEYYKYCDYCGDCMEEAESEAGLDDDDEDEDDYDDDEYDEYYDTYPGPDIESGFVKYSPATEATDRKHITDSSHVDKEKIIKHMKKILAELEGGDEDVEDK